MSKATLEAYLERTNYRGAYSDALYDCTCSGNSNAPTTTVIPREAPKRFVKPTETVRAQPEGSRVIMTKSEEAVRNMANTRGGTRSNGQDNGAGSQTPAPTRTPTTTTPRSTTPNPTPDTPPTQNGGQGPNNGNGSAPDADPPVYMPPVIHNNFTPPQGGSQDPIGETDMPGEENPTVPDENGALDKTDTGLSSLSKGQKWALGGLALGLLFLITRKEEDKEKKDV